ncbi:NUDIX hydrolase [Candidatus Izimaplasma bacterium ZiA1]|uniref:NUDIX hydrolase n=1 Tax=Candidatus Izimoplasma sp. ZiA1 TaxID=2024899 RepID=UPI000BAA5FEA|nr:NUDIX hydrolase [Candidatus Izimaplasma bacterium ZiA1]
MKKYNLIMVFNNEEDKVLMCFRSKNPYLGLYNLVGGKIDDGEDIKESAYRELFEETNITKKDIILEPLMDFKWHPIKMEMYVYAGVLKHDVKLIEEVHKLYWVSLDENFFDMSKFAGEGNIGHMMEIYFQVKNILKQTS